MAQASAQIGFSAAAAALVPTSCLPEMSFAAYLEMLTEGETRKQLEFAAARFGLNPAGTNRLLEESTHRARLLNQARILLLALAPHEQEIRKFLTEDPNA